MMKKIIIPMMLAFASTMANAEYMIKIPLEQAQGGSLPTGSIQFTNQEPAAPTENWVAIEPQYSSWVDEGTPYNCQFSPSTEEIYFNKSFTQTWQCSQSKSRTKQSREMEEISGAVRDSGDLLTEVETVIVTESNESRGTMSIVGCFYDEEIEEMDFEYYMSLPPEESIAYLESLYRGFYWREVHFSDTNIHLNANVPNLSENKIFSSMDSYLAFLSSGYSRNGYKVTRGNYVRVEGINTYYQICIQPI